MLTYDTIAALRAAAAPTGPESAITRGHTTAGDNGGSEFYWDAASTASDDNGGVVKPAAVTGAGRWRLAERSVVRGEQFGAFGNGTEVGAALAAAAVAVDGTGALELRAGTYLMDGGTIQGKHVHLICAGEPVVLKRTASTAPGTLIIVSGSIGSFSLLDADALAGTNLLVCSALAASLSEGQLLQITSDAAFEPLSTRVQGEMATVREVHGNTIYLTQPLHDTYLESSNAKIAVVDPGTFSVTGRLVIDRDRTAIPNTDTHGIQLSYLDSPHGALEMRNIQASGLTLYSCWCPRFQVDAINHARRDQDEGQPVRAMNSTMYGRFTGTAAYARHAFASGASGEYYGVPWDNRVTMTAIGNANAIFDCHPQVGSTYFDDCVAISGAITDVLGTVAIGGAAAGATSVPTTALGRAAPSGSTVTFSGGVTATLTAAAVVGATTLSVNPLAGAVAAGEMISRTGRATGFSLGGRYNYVSNARCVGLATGVGPRGDARTVQVIDIDGIVMQDCAGGAFTFNQTLDTTVARVRIRGVRGRVGDSAAVHLLKGTIADLLDVSDIHVEGRLLHISATSTFSLPEHLKLASASSRFAEAQSSSVRAIYILNSGVGKVQLYDVYSEAGEMLRTGEAVDLDVLEVVGGGGRQSYASYLNLEGGCEVCVVRGGDWDGAQIANAALVRIYNSTPVTYVEIAPARTAGSNLARALTAAAGTTVAWYRLDGHMPSITSDLVGVSGTPVQILAGTPQFPILTRSAAAPAHAAQVGSKHLNSAGAVGAQEWNKQSGTGATGWVAVH
jgi:hypothetical protein